MTIIKPFRDLVEEDLPGYLESKENPDEWYILVGDMVTEYSVWADEALSEDYEELQEERPLEDRDATPNTEGYLQIGTAGWLSSGFDFEESPNGFVSEVQWGDKIECNLLNMLVVHEDILSEDALDVAKDRPEAEA